jgi:hypothetical protein
MWKSGTTPTLILTSELDGVVSFKIATFNPRERAPPVFNKEAMGTPHSWSWHFGEENKSYSRREWNDDSSVIQFVTYSMPEGTNLYKIMAPEGGRAASTTWGATNIRC